MGINLAWIIPVAIVAGMLLAAVEWGQRELRAAARRDQEALDRAADAIPPLPDVTRGAGT